MLSLAKTFPTFPSNVLPTSLHNHHHVQFLSFCTIKSSSNSNSTDDGESTSAPAAARPSILAPDSVEIRFRRGSRRRRKEQEGGGIDGMPMKAKASPPKDWESMSLTEKAMELYVGEKGLLFWLNKFAYASIFIIIGAWILFRFVGPALNLYQLDTPPLAPDSIFKGS